VAQHFPGEWLTILLTIAKIQRKPELLIAFVCCGQVFHAIRGSNGFFVNPCIKLIKFINGEKIAPSERGYCYRRGCQSKKINPSTMEPKIVKGLYFAGEVMNVDALTGGYNLQIAFSTGYLSGASAAGT